MFFVITAMLIKKVNGNWVIAVGLEANCIASFCVAWIVNFYVFSS